MKASDNIKAMTYSNANHFPSADTQRLAAILLENSNNFDPEDTVLIVGSVARGSARLNSDIDVMVIAAGCDPDADFTTEAVWKNFHITLSTDPSLQVHFIVGYRENICEWFDQYPRHTETPYVLHMLASSVLFL